MASAEEKAAAKVVKEVGTLVEQHLNEKPRVNKDYIVKLLKEADRAFPVLGQSPSLKTAIEPLSKSLVRHNLLQHKDKDVRVLVASCLCQIIRVLAPHPPYSDEILRDIFMLIISMFAELYDTNSTYFSRRVQILETVARLKCCLIMMDIGCDDLVLKMFNIFFSVVRDHHQQSLLQSMLSIMALILEEKVTEPLLGVIMRNLLKEEKGSAPAAFRLAVSIIQDCSDKLEPFVRGFLTSSILDRDSVESELKEHYHEIIVEIFQYAPQMLLAVIPSLSHELLTDQVDVRIKAVNLLGMLFALPGRHIVQEYHPLFVEYLKRFSDKSAEVRISTLRCAKACYTAIPSGTEAHEVRAAIEERLLDFDEKVRTEAVITVCDLAKFNLKCIPSDLILKATERLRDKKVSVRKNTMQKLLELYREYCTQCAEGLVSIGGHFEQIPCKIIMLCYDKDCMDFRPQNMELVLAEDMFPTSLSAEERIRHWIFLFSVFSPAHVKAFHSILSQKWRLQMEMHTYLKLRKEEKDNNSDEVRKKIKNSFKKMSASFVDPSKAEECFQMLQQMKDEDVFNRLLLLLNEKTSVDALADAREELLRRIEDKHPLYVFLRTLSLKCSFNIFGSEHVHHILSDISRENMGNKHFEDSSINLLLNVVSISPSLLRGSEEQLRMLLSEEENPYREKLLQMVVKASRYLSIKLRDIYSSLEMTCLEGTRSESKYAISAIAAFADSSHDSAFSNLYEKLVDSLHARQNISTVLQSLGCIAQYSLLSYESREDEITQTIQTIFHETDVQSFEDVASVDEVHGCSLSCRLKIYGLKTLVKSCLPCHGTQIRPQIKELFILLSKILPEGIFSDDGDVSSEDEKSHVRLAAAKSVLQLARRWDAHISPQMFHSVILKSRDPSSLVRKGFLDKIHKLLKERSIPTRYACAFPLAASDSVENVRDNALKYMEEFIREQSKTARICQSSAMPDQGGQLTKFPGYIVVFLVHVLAHDPCFPSETCQDEETYAKLCSPLIAILQALVSADSSKNVTNDTISYMLNVFRAIRKAEDAFDVHKTPKLHILADIGMLLLKVLSSTGITAHLPGLMLLPSSFYKDTLDTRYDENSRCPFDETSIRKVLELSRLDSRKHDIVGVSLHKEADKSSSRTKEGKENSQKTARQVNTRGKSKRAASPKEVNGSSSLRNEMSSSCASVVTRRTQTRSQSGPLEEKMRTRSTRKSVMEPCSSSGTGLKSHSNSKGVGDMDERLIGQRIRLWSPIDKCFYSGSIDAFDSQSSSHKVSYDNGEVELLSLAREKWEVVSNVSSPEEVVENLDPTPTSDSWMESSMGSELETENQGSNRVSTNTRDKQVKRKGDTKNEKVAAAAAVAGKRKKQSKTPVVVDESAIARRTRSRKA